MASIDGTSGNDTLTGTAGSDEIYGLAGDDTIAGGAGYDTLYGGTGNDTLFGEDSSDDDMYGGAGQDTLFGGNADFNYLYGGDDADIITDGSGSGSLDGGAGNDGLYAGAGNDTLEGFDGDDTLEGGDGNDSHYGGLGSDTIFGGAGDDLIQGQQDDDELYGGTGADTFQFASASGNDTIEGGEGGGPDTLEFFDPVNTDVVYNGAESGTITMGPSANKDFIQIERIITSSGDDTIDATLDTAGATFETNAGNDSIIGGSGNDSILAGTGDDIIATGGGDDSVDAGDGNDIVFADGGDTSIEGGVGTADRIIFGGSFKDYTYDIDGVGRLLVTEIASGDVTTVDGFEQITFDEGTFDLVTGTTGADSIAAVDSDPSFIVVGDGADSGGGNIAGDVIIAGGDIDNLGGGDGDDTLYGGAGADGIGGDAGNDEVFGGAGNDGLGGGIGNDTVFGDAGDDGIGGDAGDDLLYGGDGNDGMGGNDGNDTLYGGDGNDGIGGDVGDDTVYGGDGDDDLGGNDGNDTVFGDAGDDTLNGDGGADTLFGGSGNDILRAGLGNDTSTGGAGNDTFMLDRAGGDDIITDFDIGDADSDGFYNDQLDVSQLQNPDTSPVRPGDVTVTNDGFGNALLIFPEGEELVLQGVTEAQMSSNAQKFAAGIPCFTAGTLIDTPKGPRLIEGLRQGDLVLTRDNGPQPVMWCAQSHLNHTALAAHPHLRPIHIQPGFAQNDRPLLVSPQHGVLMKTQNGDEVFARAVHLARGRGVRVAHGVTQVTYVHLLLPRHQVVMTQGVASESFYPGPWGLATLSPAALLALHLACPDLIRDTYGLKARQFAPAKSVKWLRQDRLLSAA